MDICLTNQHDMPTQRIQMSSIVRLQSWIQVPTTNTLEGCQSLIEYLKLFQSSEMFNKSNIDLQCQLSGNKLSKWWVDFSPAAWEVRRRDFDSNTAFNGILLSHEMNHIVSSSKIHPKCRKDLKIRPITSQRPFTSMGHGLGNCSLTASSKEDVVSTCWSVGVFLSNLGELRPVLFVVQVISSIDRQDCIHNKRIPQCTKIRLCIHNQ